MLERRKYSEEIDVLGMGWFGFLFFLAVGCIWNWGGGISFCGGRDRDVLQLLGYVHSSTYICGHAWKQWYAWLT